MEKTLLIMAAGMGSRFGGLKQIEPFGPNGEFLIDYSIYDALKEGFTKVVFVIKKENEKIFKETIGSRVPSNIHVEYVFQDLKKLPKGYEVPENREKPWGTGHAILAAKDVVNEPFAIINADDFYGRDAYRVASTFLENNKDIRNYAIVGYQINNTLSSYGAVKRGICLEENGKFIGLKESEVIKENGVITAKPLDGGETLILKDNSLVSMNLLCLSPDIFPYLEEKFSEFLDNNLKKNPLLCEYSIPTVLDQAYENGEANVEIIKTNSVWYGVTYKDDKSDVVVAINEMIENGIYPKNLWHTFYE